MRARGAVSVVAVGLVLLLVACDDSAPRPRGGVRSPVATPTAQDTRVIGLVATLSGPDAWRGENAFEGADVGVNVLNRSVGNEGDVYELVTLDDEGDPDLARAQLEQLAASDRTAGIVYAGPPEVLPAAEEALAAAGIPALACFGDLYGARALSPHVFQMSPSLVWEGRSLARYIVKDRRYERVGALVADTMDGLSARRTLRAEVERAGGRAPLVLTYDDDLGRFEPVLERLRARRAEAVVLQGDPDSLRQMFEALAAMGAGYIDTPAARTASAPRKQRRRRLRSNRWHPQVLGFDPMIADFLGAPTGVVASDTYARGAFYLPVPSFESFTTTFERWWDEEPTGWELRSFEAVGALGWADRSASGGRDRARALEALRGRRFGGLDITFGPDDHTAVGATTVGLWTDRGPGPATRRQEAAGLTWVPLARGFSIDGERTTILPEDWRHLFRRAPPKTAPGPPLTRMRFGIATPRRDPKG